MDVGIRERPRRGRDGGPWRTASGSPARGGPPCERSGPRSAERSWSAATLAEDRLAVAEHHQVADPVRPEARAPGAASSRVEHLLDALRRRSSGARAARALLGLDVHPAGRAERGVVGDVGIGDREHDPRAREPARSRTRPRDSARSGCRRAPSSRSCRDRRRGRAASPRRGRRRRARRAVRGSGRQLLSPGAAACCTASVSET